MNLQLDRMAMLESLASTPMLMMESRMAYLCALIAGEQAAADGKNLSDNASNQVRRIGSVAVVPVAGVFWSGYSDQLIEGGVLSTDVLQGVIASLAMDKGVSAIVLDIDSPGGSSAGIIELAREVKAAAQKKPVVSYASGQMASAAYWVGSQASMIYATDSATIGSIGAFVAFADWTKYLDSMGVSVEVFASGPFKAMGAMGTSLNDDHRRNIQERVDEVASQFKAAVQSARAGMVPDDVMDGRMFSAARASDLRLIDAVATKGAAIDAVSRRR